MDVMDRASCWRRDDGLRQWWRLMLKMVHDDVMMRRRRQRLHEHDGLPLRYRDEKTIRCRLCHRWQRGCVVGLHSCFP